MWNPCTKNKTGHYLNIKDKDAQHPSKKKKTQQLFKYQRYRYSFPQIKGRRKNM